MQQQQCDTNIQKYEEEDQASRYELIIDSNSKKNGKQ